jgi:PIN domain
MAHYYFDANALIKYSALQDYKNEQGVDEIRQLVSQPDNTIFYSSLTLLESWNVIFKSYRQGLFGAKQKKKNKALQIIITKLMQDLQYSPFVKLDIPMSENTVTQAHLLIERYGMSKDVGTVDMLHIALVKFSSIESLIMVSSDKVVNNICISLNINSFDPQKLAE